MQELDLAKAEDVLRYLDGTSEFKSHTAMPLTGGFGNYVFRIHLQHEYRGRASYVLKHGKDHVPGMSLKFSLNRQVYEVEALRQAKKCLSGNPLVRVPEVHLFDNVMHVIIMDDCGENVVTLKDFLLQDTLIHTSIGASIGSALGDFIAELHTRGRDEDMLTRFDSNTDGRELSAFVTYGRTVATITGGNVTTALTDPLLDILPETLDAVSSITEEMCDKIMTARETVVMGDFWTGNVLVDVQRDEERLSTVVRGVYVVDWEMAKPGLAALDVGQFCAELELLRIFSPVNGAAASETTNAFCHAYSARRGKDLNVARMAVMHVGAHLATLTPRNATWNALKGKQAVREMVCKGIEYLVEGKRASEGYISSSPVGGLLNAA